MRNGSARLDSGGSAVSGSLWQVGSLNVVARVRCEVPLALFKSRAVSPPALGGAQPGPWLRTSAATFKFLGFSLGGPWPSAVPALRHAPRAPCLPGLPVAARIAPVAPRGPRGAAPARPDPGPLAVGPLGSSSCFLKNSEHEAQPCPGCDSDASGPARARDLVPVGHLGRPPLSGSASTTSSRWPKLAEPWTKAAGSTEWHQAATQRTQSGRRGQPEASLGLLG